MKLQSISCIALLALALFASGCKALFLEPEIMTGQTEQILRHKDRSATDYLLYIPPSYATAKEPWPLILFLHGAGERGNNVQQVALHGPPKLIAEQKKNFPFIIASPQCPAGEWWSNNRQIDNLDALLKHLVENYRIDADRIYVTGLSMGGYGTWRLADKFPSRFAAIAPVCGKGEPKTVAKIKHLPIWVFHGVKDDTIPFKASQVMVDALKKVGNDVRFTAYPEAKHDSWTATYENPELYEWLLSHRRSPEK